MNHKTIFSISIQSSIPDAVAIVRGGENNPEIRGVANFYQTRWNTGLMVEVEFSGLPNDRTHSPRFFAMHLHENGDCSDNFSNTGMHYNPTMAVHPYHLGDFPAILNSNGYAYMVFYDSFLELSDILDRSLILHEKRDDFVSQPSGDAGEKIACGVIRKHISYWG